MNAIVHGDCLEKMQTMESNSIDLIYLDPPFFSGKLHILYDENKGKEFSFDDNWSDKNEYHKFLKERVILMHRLLKDTGSIFIHCDKNAEHIIRNILEDVFGEENFQSEIIWTYKRWSNAKKGLLSSHQNIYFYSKTGAFKFNTIYTDYSETTNIDQILQRRTRNENNKSVYETDSLGNHVNCAEKKGVPLSDVWEIPYLNPRAKERVGYPTQKPILLLEKILQISTNKGDVVLDPFCGSGTTCVAAQLLGRTYIGIDISEEAIKLTKERLTNPIKTESQLLKNGRSAYNSNDTNLLKVLNGLEYNIVQRNKNIDAILVEKYKDGPVLIKIQRKGENMLKLLYSMGDTMKKKRSEKAFIIQTEIEESPLIRMDGIEVIQSPSLLVRKKIKGLV